MPLISVIVPCYNQAQYLDECLHSVLDQTFQDWECLIVNDGSSDHTEEVAKKWVEKDARFKYLYKENGGLSSARNGGLCKAVSEYVFFLDSDDQLNNSSVFQWYFNRVNCVEYDLISSNLQEIYDHTVIKNSYFNCKGKKDVVLEGKEVLQGFLDKELSVIACNKLIKRELICRNELFFKEKIFHEDEIFVFQLSLVSTKVLLMPLITYNYNRKNLMSITNTVTNKNFEDKILIVRDYLAAIDTNNLLEKIDNKSLIQRFINLAVNILHSDFLRNDEDKWIYFFKQLKKDYRRSKLSRFKKLLRLPPKISYHVYRIQTSTKKTIIMLFTKKVLKHFTVI